jgi:uncharacterized protein
VKFERGQLFVEPGFGAAHGALPPPLGGEGFWRLDIPARWCHRGSVSLNKLQELRGLLRGFGSCLVAYSGGVDSAFLALMARQVLGDKCLAALADSPSLPRRELAQATDLAARFSIPLHVLRTAEFDNPAYVSNPNNRCYFCKHELFSQLTPLARERNFAVIAYGENASDVGDHRPGALAAGQFQVRAPLKEAGLTKTEIRALSAHYGLPTADKPQMACLSSRVPCGEPVTPEKLRMIEEAEYVLRDLGFHDVRVRHHQSPGAGPAAPLARIELGAAEMAAFLSEGMFERVAGALGKLGYAHVTLDLRGYRRGGASQAASSLPPPGGLD